MLALVTASQIASAFQVPGVRETNSEMRRKPLCQAGRVAVSERITTIGLDIAKSVFQVHGVDAAGEVVIRRQLKRRYVLAEGGMVSPTSRTCASLTSMRPSITGPTPESLSPVNWLILGASATLSNQTGHDA
jgi:hypothetical protein